MIRSVVLPIITAMLVAVSMAVSGQARTGQSDALILIQPLGDRVMVNVTYPQKVPNQPVLESLAAVAASAGWRVGGMAVHDDLVESQQGGRRHVETSGTATYFNAPQVSNGGLLVQPYIDAFQSHHRLRIMYMMQGFTGFQGLRSFKSQALTVDLVRDGGPFEYLVVIRDHSGPLPRLPLTQAVPGAAPAAAAARGRVFWQALAPVAVVAALAGLTVTLLLLARARARRGQHAQPRDIPAPGQTAQSPAARRGTKGS